MKNFTKTDKAWIDGYLDGYQSAEKDIKEKSDLSKDAAQLIIRVLGILLKIQTFGRDKHENFNRR